MIVLATLSKYLLCVIHYARHYEEHIHKTLNCEMIMKIFGLTLA